MDFDNSWQALLKPGEATVYFDVLSDNPVQANATAYSKINAWWMAEFCRLIYRQESNEVGASFSGPTRQEILTQVGFDEVKFFNVAEADKGDTQCAIIRTRDGAAAPFAVLVFRGTSNLQDWLTNLRAFPDQWQGVGRVHRGFAAALDLVWRDVEMELAKLEAMNCPVFYTGHSLGAALATLAASLRLPRALYTYGSPLVGDKDFAATLAGQQVYRVVNNRDLVTAVPPALVFCHLGELHYITHNGEMKVNPGRFEMARDLLRGAPLSLITSGFQQGLPEPPEQLADHTPVNYVAHLERLFSQAPDA